MSVIIENDNGVRLTAGLLNSSIVVLLFILAFLAIINMGFCIENINIMRVFESDESQLTELLMRILPDNRPDPRWLYHYDSFYNYGSFYHLVTFFLLRGVHRLGYDIFTVRFAAFTFRLVSFFSSISVLFLMEKILKRIDVQQPLRMLSVLTLASLPNYYFWSQRIHPDMLQAALLMLAFYILTVRITATTTLVAGAVAGLAFGTKYGGIFILPFLFMPYGIQILAGDGATSRKLMNLFIMGVLTVSVFLGAWLAVSPYVVYDFNKFWAGFKEVSKILREGYVIKDKNPFVWLRILSKEFSIPLALLICGGVIYETYELLHSINHENALSRIRTNPEILPRTAWFLFCIVSFGYLFLFIRTRESRYTFHFLPLVVVVAYIGFDHFSRRLSAFWKPVFCFVLFTPVALNAVATINSESSVSKQYSNEYIQAGDWLQQHYAKDTKIVADFYSYVPPAFSNAEILWGIYQAVLDTRHPDVVILNANLSGRWSWKKLGTSFKDKNFILGPGDNAGYFIDFHQTLASDRYHWKVAYETEHIVILERLKP